MEPGPQKWKKAQITCAGTQAATVIQTRYRGRKPAPRRGGPSAAPPPAGGEDSAGGTRGAPGREAPGRRAPDSPDALVQRVQLVATEPVFQAVTEYGSAADIIAKNPAMLPTTYPAR